MHSVSASGVRRRTPYASRPAARLGDPVLLVPGFLAGDGSLLLMSRALRQRGPPHLSLGHPRQRRLHAGRRRPAGGAARGDRPASRLARADRGPQPRRHARPRRRRASPRPGLGHRHDGQPDAGAGCPPRLAGPQRRPARAPPPRRDARPDGRGLRGRALRPRELRPGPGRAARRRRLHRDLQQARRHRGLACVHRPGGPCRSRCGRPTSAWPSTPQVIAAVVGRAAAAGARRQLSKSIGERSRSFESRCSAVIDRTVPLRERITSECVVTPSPR